MERVLAIDPGEKVGWAVGVISDDGLVVTSHGINSMWAFLNALDDALSEGRYDQIVYENYRIAADKAKEHTGSTVPTIQVIGVIRFLAFQHHVHIKDQAPQKMATGVKFAKGHLPAVQEILDRMPRTHDDEHDGAAIRHLVAYYFDTKVKPYAQPDG